MASNATVFVRQVTRRGEDYRLGLRILRLWRLYELKNPNEIKSIEMILVDEEGGKIQATVYKRWVRHFNRILTEKATLFVDGPEVEANEGKYKYLDFPFKFTFSCRTKLARCKDFVGQLHAFDFVGLDTILGYPPSTERVLDVIGVVVEVHELQKSTTPPNRTSERMDLYVEDVEKRRLKITLWGDLAVTFQNYVSTNLDKPLPIIVLQFGKMKFFRGLPCVSTLYGITNFVINGELDVVKEFCDRLEAEQADPSVQSAPRTIASILHSLKTDFIGANEAMCMSAVLSINTARRLVVVGTIKYIADDLPWFYPGCTACGHKVIDAYDELTDADDTTADGEAKKTLACSNQFCTATAVASVPRFKLQIRAEDPTGFVYLTMWDGDVARLINSTARDMATRHKEGATSTPLPVEFNVLLEKKFAFLIEVTEYNVKNNSPVYKVVRMASSPDIICELETRLGLDEVNAGASNHENTPDSGTRAAIVTPSTSKGKLPMVTESQRVVKRNLLDAFAETETPSGPAANAKSRALAQGMKKV